MLFTFRILEGIRAKVATRLKKMLDIQTKRIIKKATERFKAEDWSPDDISTLTEDELAGLYKFLEDSIEVTLVISRGQAMREELDVDASIRNEMKVRDEVLDRWYEYTTKMLDEAKGAQVQTVLDVYEEKGPDLYEMGRRLEEMDMFKSRADTIAITETGKLYLDNYSTILKDNGFTHVQWKCSPDDKVCDECREYDGAVMTIEEASDLFPVHPRDRCWFNGIVPDDLEY